jgi:hypothetical protein
VVNYPIPFGTPPNLKLASAKREYLILTENEYGFSWGVRATAEDFEPGTLEDTMYGSYLTAALRTGVALSAAGSFLSNKLKPGLQFEDFVWEARGVQGKPAPKVTTEKGDFASLPNTEGEVAFGMTFAQPPNLSFPEDYTRGRTAVVGITTTGFKWKNVTSKMDEGFGRGTVSWIAKGVRAEGK